VLGLLGLGAGFFVVEEVAVQARPMHTVDAPSRKAGLSGGKP
jgi:hypothetical protein